MKKSRIILISVTIVLLMASFVFSNGGEEQTAPAGGELSTVANALITFEANVKWAAVSRNWRGIRADWINAVKGVSNAQDLGKLLLKLEENMGWNSVSQQWKRIRPGWVQGCQSAELSVNNVAGLLLQLETNTLWSAVDQKWKAIRPEWINTLKGIAQGGGM